MKQYLTHSEALAVFEIFGEVWYELDEIDGGKATVVSESCGDTLDDVIEDRIYFKEIDDEN